MESLFLLFSTVVLALLVLLSSFTPVTLGRIQSPTDEQILTVSDGQQPPPSSSSFTLLQPQDYKAGNQPIRHFWHWVQQQQQPREQEREWTDKDKPKNNRRRRKEVANGEEAEESSSDEEQFKNMSDIVRLHHDDKKTSSGGHHRNQTHESHGIHVASWRWEEVGVLFTFTSFIVVAGLAKVAFHHAHVISSRIPESCLLILLGTAVGGILYAAGVGTCEPGATKIAGCHSDDDGNSFTFPTFTPNLFFFILLPPIILESSYSLYDRAFADNVGTVLFYAVIGTIFNTFLIGLSLLGLVNIGWIGLVSVPPESSVSWWSGPLYQLEATDCLVFSALISAVDPVAVLAIFQEVGINKDLYFLVFGESLLNDAVTVVLYTMMVAFATMNGHVSGEQYALGFASFFTVSLGGLSIGIICGLITALITRTTTEVRVVEPLAVFGMAYFSYLSAELFHFSGIISTIGCGLVQAHYAFANISHKSFTTVKYFIKMLSSTSDAIIFLFLGMVLVNDVHEWHTGFVLWTLLLCLVARFAGVFLLTAIANRFRLKPINLQEQFIMAYGGLRGAVSFSLVEMLTPDVIKPRQMFVTTTLAVILFTVFVQGGTIKLFVRLLHIKKDNKDARHLFSEVNETLFDHLTAGIEEICGHRGNNFFRERIEYLDERYLRPIFTLDTDKNSLQRLFEKLTLSEHVANMYTAVTNDQQELPVDMIEPLLLEEDASQQQQLQQQQQQALPSVNEVEGSPLLPITPLPGQVERQTITPLKKFPLVRQQSAPPGSRWVTASAVGRDQHLSQQGKNENINEIPEFPGVQLRRQKSLTRRSRPNSGESTNSGSLDPEATAQAFRKALRSTSNNQYKRFFQKHNKNLIGDDELPPELEMALRSRRVSSTPAGRFAQTPSSLFNSPISSPNSPESPKSPRNNPSISLDSGTHFPFSVNGENGPVRTSASAIAKREGRQSISPARNTGVEYSTENERPTSLISAGRRPQRPDSLRPAFIRPLGAIAERDGEQTRSVLLIQDIEDDDNVFQQPKTRRASRETGV